MGRDALSRVVWRVSLPIILAQASETLLHLIDTIFLARVGVTELGALAVADSVVLLFLVVPLALVDGIQILTARRAGQRRPEAVGAVFNQGFALVLGVCVASTAALKLLSPLAVPWFVESESVGAAVGDFVQIAAYGIPFAGAGFACSAVLVSLGRTKVLIPATVILAVTSIVLDYIFIFGKLGAPALGMRGAAIGSVGAEVAASLFLTVYVWRALDSRRYEFLRSWRFERRTARLLNVVSAPIAVQRTLETLRWLAFFLILERVSDRALAIANIVYTCSVVFWIPTDGFAETSCSMVSRFVGRNQAHRIGGVLRHAVGGAALVTIPFIAAALLVPDWFLAVFNPESDLLAEGTASLRVVALAMLIVIPGEMWFAAVAGTGDTAAALGIELIATVTMLGAAYLAAIHFTWPVELVWISLPAAWLVCLTISYGWIKSGIWKRLEIS
jgi:multidrug resistance protein, MATE family